MTITIREDLADEYHWTKIETITDEFGQLTGKRTIYDNNTTRTVEFSDGLRVRSDQYDISADGSAVNWKYSTREYDGNGQLTEKFTHYDNDIGRKVDFSNGLRVGILQNDMSADGSAFNWWYSIRHYDGNGQLTEKLTSYDNDTTRHIEFDNGLRVRTVQEDTSADGSAANWQEITKNYDTEGNIKNKIRLDDDGDQFVFEFSEGAVTRSIVSDGDESDDWLIKVTTFDTDQGSKDIVTYDNLNDVPDDILMYFDFVFV